MEGVQFPACLELDGLGYFLVPQKITTSTLETEDSFFYRNLLSSRLPCAGSFFSPPDSKVLEFFFDVRAKFPFRDLNRAPVPPGLEQSRSVGRLLLRRSLFGLGGRCFQHVDGFLPFRTTLRSGTGQPRGIRPVFFLDTGHSPWPRSKANVRPFFFLRPFFSPISAAIEFFTSYRGGFFSPDTAQRFACVRGPLLPLVPAGSFFKSF